MSLQLIIVYIIVACAVGAVIRYAYRQVRGKNSGCNCGECARSNACPKSGGECHCSASTHNRVTAAK